MECSADNHLKAQDLFCNECNSRVCSKCFKSHSSHADKIVDIDQILTESLNNVENIVKFIEDNQEKKNKMEEIFNTTVDKDYESELQSITNYFKELHDSLHYKEVDLKTELKSNYDENYEIYIKMTSEIENNVNQSQQILKLLDSAKDDNDLVIKKFNEFKHLSESSKIPVQPFMSYKFKQVPYTDFETIMNKNVLKPPTHLADNKDQYIYLWYNELERFNMKTKKIEKVETKPMEKRPDSIWQSMCSTKTNLYIFNKANWWKYEPSTQSWIVKAIPGDVDLGGYQPVFYDGKKHIYLLGGYKGDTFLLNVTRFNIETEEFEFNFTKLNTSHQNNPVIIDGNEKLIYLIGGYHHKDTDTLDVLDVDARTVKTIRTFKGDGFPNLTTGCYIPSNNSIYMITREYLFCRYDLKEKKVIPLANPQGNGFYNRLFFDGDNTMFLISTKLKSLLEYNINTNSWSTTMEFSPNSGYGSALANF